MGEVLDPPPPKKKNLYEFHINKIEIMLNYYEK